MPTPSADGHELPPAPKISRSLTGDQLIVAQAVGRTIRELRARRGLSQEDLGFRAGGGGVHRNYVGAVERAEVNATLAVIVRIVSGLGLPLTEVLGVLERHLRDLGLSTGRGD